MKSEARPSARIFRIMVSVSLLASGELSRLRFFHRRRRPANIRWTFRRIVSTNGPKEDYTMRLTSLAAGILTLILIGSLVILCWMPGVAGGARLLPCDEPAASGSPQNEQQFPSHRRR